MMRSKISFLKPIGLLLLGAMSLGFMYAIPTSHITSVTNLSTENKSESRIDECLNLYDSLGLDSLALSKDAYICAVQGLDSLGNVGVLKNDSIISIVDFSLPSSKKRLFIIDLSAGKLLFNTFVSHGRNSGKETASRFSNKLNSFESSLGFYVTGNTYKGEHGYSMRLMGLEKGINDNAFNRGIVMHSAAYVNEGLIKSQGYIGRSLGCPAVPISLHKAIIKTIKEGSCLYVYSPDKKYIAHSKFPKPFISHA